MAETAKKDDAKADDAKAAKDSSQADAQANPTFDKERLIAEATDFFDQPAHVVAGALEGGNKKNYTRAEAEKAINTFLKREVTTDDDETEG